jgi:hypothetical protein
LTRFLYAEPVFTLNALRLYGIALVLVAAFAFCSANCPVCCASCNGSWGDALSDEDAAQSGD